MQGKQNAANLERKGPHKSMHCNFCKPPGAVVVEKPSGPQLETKTKVHLIHQLADLRLTSTNNEPGFPSVESEACMCILEGENPCPKCVPDKNRPPPKKKVCRCPKGAKPHPSMFNETAPKKKKTKEEDDEFWWEKYSREHDAMARETWAAYMAQRRKDKKFNKCQSQSLERSTAKTTKGNPNWYRKLSCQQMIYVEFLSTAIRLDSDENITDRTYFVLGGIGMVPRPSRKFLKKCLRYCHYNAVQFLNQLHLLIKELDPYDEKYFPPSLKKNPPLLYTWNEILIMSCICYLEFPAILRELMDRLPPLPREKILPQIPYPVFPILPKKKYENPYEEPLWEDRLNWSEKMKIDRLNRCRAHMETKRVKIPPLALVRRPSLIDARPPFLAQIEANERASRRIVKEKKKRPQRKHPISTFNSAVDVTAIAGIEASEISTTDKADTDDICVFLREPKESESMEGVESEEESDFPLPKEVRFPEETQETPKKPCSEVEDNSDAEEADEISFRTPPKTKSGETIASPCPPPDGTPGPPASHFETGKRELDILDDEICKFFPFVSSSRQTVQENVGYEADDVRLKLKSAAAKLKKLSQGVSDSESKKHSKKKKKKCNKKGKSRKSASKKTTKKANLSEKRQDESTYHVEEKEEEEDEEEEEEEEEGEIQEHYMEEDEDLEGDDIKMTYKKRGKYLSSRGSEISDPDPDTDDEWSARPPCTPDAPQFEEQEKPEKKRKRKKRGKSLKRKPRKKCIKKKKKGKELKAKGMQNRKSQGTVTKENFKSLNNNPEGGREGTEEENGSEEIGEIVFMGEVEPLVKKIIQDLAEEGFYCASYPSLHKHPDVQQLILHLKGKILTKKLRNELLKEIKYTWSKMKDPLMFHIPQLGLPRKRIWFANWNDKKLVSRLAKSKIDQFYFKVARDRAVIGSNIYNSSHQYYFGTDRYLKFFYAYMVSKYEDVILKGSF